MARGDVVVDLVTVAAASNVDARPVAGVEWLVMELFVTRLTGSNAVDARITDGSLTIAIVQNTGGATASRLEGKLFLTNNVYLNIATGGATTANFSYHGVQTK